MNERVTVEVDSETLKRARAAGVDLSFELKRALRRRLPLLSQHENELAADQWYRDNKEAVESCNDFIESHGLLASRLRYRPEHE